MSQIETPCSPNSRLKFGRPCIRGSENKRKISSAIWNAVTVPRITLAYRYLYRNRRDILSRQNIVPDILPTMKKKHPCGSIRKSVVQMGFISSVRIREFAAANHVSRPEMQAIRIMQQNARGLMDLKRSNRNLPPRGRSKVRWLLAMDIVWALIVDSEKIGFGI